MGGSGGPPDVNPVARGRLAVRRWKRRWHASAQYVPTAPSPICPTRGSSPLDHCRHCAESRSLRVWSGMSWGVGQLAGGEAFDGVVARLVREAGCPLGRSSTSVTGWTMIS
jgi:hypothetical protein